MWPIKRVTTYLLLDTRVFTTVYKSHDRCFNEICKHSTAVIFICVKFVTSADGNTAVTLNLLSTVTFSFCTWLVVNKLAIRQPVPWSMLVGKATFRTFCNINDMCYTICILPKHTENVYRCQIYHTKLHEIRQRNATLNPLYTFLILILLLRETSEFQSVGNSVMA